MTAATYLHGLAKCGVAVAATGFGVPTLIETDEALTRCVSAMRAAGVVHLIGNGGSAAVVAHAQNDLVKTAGIRALVHQDIPLLTAYANDNGYENGYAQALRAWVQPTDLVIAVSSSGTSENMLYAVNVARERGAQVLTCSGFEPSNRLRAIGDVNFYVPSSNYGYVELTHAALLHYLTDRLANHVVE